jgi:hypothetical protein
MDTNIEKNNNNNGNIKRWYRNAVWNISRRLMCLHLE